MTRDQLIKEFEDYIAVAAIAESLLEERSELRSRMDLIKSGLNTDGMPHAGSTEADKKVVGLIAKLDRLLPRIIDALADSVAKRIRVEDYIEMITEPRWQAVMRLRYGNRLSMEEVSRKMKTVPGETHYSRKQCWRYFNAGINEIISKLNNDTECPTKK